MHKLIDELGRLEEKLAPKLAALKPQTDRVKKLKDEIAERTAAGEQVVKGKVYGASVGPNALKREITDKPQLFKILGAKQFFTECSFALGPFDRLVKSGAIAAHQVIDLLHEERTGARRIDTYRLKA